MFVAAIAVDSILFASKPNSVNLLLLLSGRLGSKILHWRGAKERKGFFGKARDLSLLSPPPLGLSNRHDFA